MSFTKKAMASEEQSEGVASSIPEETGFNQLFSGSSSDRSLASSPASEEDDLIGCIPEEQESQLSSDESNDEKRNWTKSPPPVPDADSRDDEAAHGVVANGAPSGERYSILHTILQQENASAGGSGGVNDVITEENSDEPDSARQGHPEDESHLEKDRKSESHSEKEHENGSHYEKEHDNGSHYEKEHENGSYHEKEHENGSYHETEHENGSYHENEHENGFHHENEHENGSHHEKGHENGSHQEERHENGSHHEERHESGSQHEKEPENGADHEREHEDESHHETDHEYKSHDETNSHPEGDQPESNREESSEAAGGDIKKKKKQPPHRKRKRKPQSLKPVAWSRASINTFSRVPQPLPSDRSASIATGASAGAGSRGSRAMSAKAAREKFRPVSNEEKISLRLRELDSLLAIDYAKEARQAYQRSVSECRQAWQNYVSTSRIMGEVQPDAAGAVRQADERSHEMEHLSHRESEPQNRGHPLGSRVAPEVSSSSQLPDQHHQEQEDQQNPIDGRQLHGYRVGAPERGVNRFGSDHRLSESGNPDVRAWLKEKNKSARRQRRDARETKRREMQEKLDSQQMRRDRKEEAEVSFLHWMRQKRQSDAVAHKKTGNAAAKVEQPLPLSDQEPVFAELESRRLAPPGPKPVHNSVFKRGSSSLGTAGASFSGRQVRMGVIGRRMDPSPPPPPQTGVSSSSSAALAIESGEHQQQQRLSFAEWSQRKAIQQSLERDSKRDSERQRREAEAAANPEMAELVPRLARRRIESAVGLKSRRTDSGLGLSRPRTAVPALSAPPPPARPSTGRASRSSLMERREAGITEQLPNPFVSPDDDVMLDRMLDTGGR